MVRRGLVHDSGDSVPCLGLSGCGAGVQMAEVMVLDLDTRPVRKKW